MKNVFLVVFMLCSYASFAGSADAILICKSASGRTVFQAKLQDLVSFTSAEFTIDGETIIYKNDTYGHVVFNAKNKVLTISINDPANGGLTFYAIPATFRTVKNTNSNEHYKFKAMIQGKDPRKGKYNSKEIELNCELTYTI